MRFVFGRARVGFGLILLLMLGLAPGVRAQTDTDTRDAGRAWYALTGQGNGSLWGIAVDDSGNGWVAGESTGQASGARLLRLQNDKLTTTQFTFPNVTINALSISRDGSEGWAVGASEAGGGAGVILHYTGGKWTQLTDPVIASTTKSYAQLALDATGKSGYAIALGPEEQYPSILMSLQNGKWSPVASDVMNSLLDVTIASGGDATHTYTWLTGYEPPPSNRMRVYTLSNGKLTPVGNPVGPYRAIDMAVDASGNGWATLMNESDPSVPAPGLLRLRMAVGQDGTTAASWQIVKNDIIAAHDNYALGTLTVDGTGNGWLLGNPMGVGSAAPPMIIFRLQGDSITPWQYTTGTELAGQANQQPVYGQPTDSAAGPGGTAYAVTFEGSLLRYGGLPSGGAFPAVAPDLPGTSQCFKQTGQCLRGQFLKFWQDGGGLARFGLPVTGMVWERLNDGKVYEVQYTERARFEWHPEKSDPRYKVLLGLLGSELVQGRQSEQPFQKAAKNPSTTYFPETGHNLAPELAAYWKKGGLAVFGYPLSEPFQEVSPTDGKTYTVQYFERNRLEYHPENKGTQYEVLLGLLGVQSYQTKYGAKP